MIKKFILKLTNKLNKRKEFMHDISDINIKNNII